MDRTDLLARAETVHQTNRALLAVLARAKGGSARMVQISPCTGWEKEPAQAGPDPEGTARLPVTPLCPPPGFASLGLLEAPCRVFACDVTGLRGRDLEAALDHIETRQRMGEALRPVILTDSPDFAPLARRGYVAEYLPRGLSDADRAFIWAKWGVEHLLDLRGHRAAPVRPPAAPAVPKPAAARPAGTRRKKAAVIAWDLGHNPVGRAIVIHDLLQRDWDVELIGPIWSRFGGKVWGPVATGNRLVRGFHCKDFADYWPAALAFASAADYDLVVACKPRLPSLLLGALIKDRCGCPLVLDVDDFELSFFPDETGASLDDLAKAGPAALREPYEELATRAAHGLIGQADALTVSNIALRSRFEGTLVRHSRDEAAFHPDRFDRAAERAAMGIGDGDFALVFVGTARAHKGVFDIAKVLAALPDKDFVLHLVGTITDRRIRAELDRHKGARIVYHPDCDFDDLPARIAAADAVVLLQDPAHPISQYQIPAKVSDASAFGLPILVTDVPPLRDLALQGMVTVVTPETLADHLRALRDQRDRGLAERQRRAVREAFEQELGNRVNRERLDFAIARAGAAGPALPDPLRRLLDIASRSYAENAAPAAKAAAVAAPARTARPAADTPDRFDLVMFWKQNDSGIYGRRSDMMVKHLIASGRVRRVLQIDTPLEVNDLARLTDPAGGSASSLVLRNAIANQYGLRDSDALLRRTHIWDRKGRRALLPEVGKSLADYPAWVEMQMARAGIDPSGAFAWVCPVVFDFPAVAARIPFRGIIGDLIDDQRKFGMSEAYRERIIASYDATLPLFDLTFTNCASQVDAFGTLAKDIRVLPNGTERIAAEGPVPDLLKSLPRPLAGYVGNLRDRIDWDLLHETATRMPDVHFVIIGGGAREGQTDALAGLSNVTFTGVVPYEQVHDCMRALDVALVPHLRNDLSASMNPLKVYNYFAARRPIVATEIDNVDAALRPFIRFAPDTPAFVSAIRSALSDPVPAGAAQTGTYEEVLEGITWESRVSALLSQIDAWTATLAREPAPC